MNILLMEPTSTRYIHVNPATNRVHLHVPFVGGQDISTDNTCRSKTELNAFFEGGGISELESYKSVLEFHMSLLEESDERRKNKEVRLTQITTYLEVVKSMRDNYQGVVNTFLSKPSNLYSIQLRPYDQDPISHVVNPVFTVNRKNDSQDTPLSPLYNKMHEVFPTLTLGKPDLRTQLITTTLKALSKNASFEDIQHVLTEQCQTLFNISVDFQNHFKNMPNGECEKHTTDKAYIDALMCFDEDATSDVYIQCLLGVCAPNLSNSFTGSPFYLGSYDNPAEQAERLSIMTQFYLGVMNVYCRAKGISDSNFGKVLDSFSALSQSLVETVSQTLSQGHDVEGALVAFFNEHKKPFSLSRALSATDKDAIQHKFEITYRIVTATKENPHMDDFMLLDTEARGKKDIFFTQKGLICTDFANIVPRNINLKCFAKIRKEAATHPDVIKLQDEPVITVEIEPEALVEKLGDVQWDKLPKEVADACRDLPAFQLRQFTDDVAKGKQDEAEAILQAFNDKQTLLRTPAKFTDYSGRTFNCTAYEYAYWAKDKHMCRMLEHHMDDETKAELLVRVEEMDRSGLVYQQHGVSYQNPHYDMGFVLKKLTHDEFHQVKTMVGQSSVKIQQATLDNYRTIPFTATEYEQLKTALKQHTRRYLPSFFDTSPAKTIGDKLQFDFRSLITALEIYVNNYDKWTSHAREMAWMTVGKAQRDVPAHIAHEYCRRDRIFGPVPSFNEERLPRVLRCYNIGSNVKSWFPLTSSSSGLGFDFAFSRWLLGCEGARVGGSTARQDVEVLRHLDTVRTADLTQSRENLSQPANQHGLVR